VSSILAISQKKSNGIVLFFFFRVQCYLLFLHILATEESFLGINLIFSYIITSDLLLCILSYTLPRYLPFQQGLYMPWWRGIHRGHRVSLQNRRSRVRIPPGCT
jgi:hypothetical protein